MTDNEPSRERIESVPYRDESNKFEMEIPRHWDHEVLADGIRWLGFEGAGGRADVSVHVRGKNPEPVGVIGMLLEWKSMRRRDRQDYLYIKDGALEGVGGPSGYLLYQHTVDGRRRLQLDWFLAGTRKMVFAIATFPQSESDLWGPVLDLLKTFRLIEDESPA